MLAGQRFAALNFNYRANYNIKNESNQAQMQNRLIKIYVSHVFLQKPLILLMFHVEHFLI